MKKQRGYNFEYPREIETWRNGEKVPDWLSDRAKVIGFSNDGNMILSMRETNTGGFELLTADGKSTLVITKGPDDYICFGDYKIFTLRPRQMELLYE